jgi:outer membrane protein W
VNRILAALTAEFLFFLQLLFGLFIVGSNVISSVAFRAIPSLKRTFSSSHIKKINKLPMVISGQFYLAGGK